MKICINLFLCLGCGMGLKAQSFALRGATLHLGNGHIMEQGLLVVEAGIIAEIVDLSIPQTTQPEYTTVLDASGMHLYPGFFLLNNIAGLTETDAVRATLDFNEMGPFSPEVRAGIAFNASSRILPTLIQNGVLFVESTPKGGIVSGQSSVLRLTGEPWTKAALKTEAALHLFWPEFVPEKIEGDAAAHADWTKRAMKRKTLLLELSQTLAEAHAGLLGQAYDVWRKVIEGKMPLMLHAMGAREAFEAMAWLDAWPQIQWALVDCNDPMVLLPELKSKNIPVVLSRIWELPWQSDADPLQRWKDAAELMRQGLTVILDYEGDMEAMGGRNFGFMAGTLTRFGLSQDEILPAVSQHPAAFMGLGQTVGLLAPGYEASFFLCSGSPFEPKSFDMKQVWIQGKEIRLDGPQERLKNAYD